MRLPEEPDLPPQINIVPMIDVIFAILTFFIMSTLYLTRSEGLPVNLPTAVTAEKQQQRQIVVTLNPQGQITVNQQPVRLEDLGGKVRALIGGNSQTLVVISADHQVHHGRVVAVMDELRKLPGVKLAIATQRTSN